MVILSAQEVPKLVCTITETSLYPRPEVKDNFPKSRLMAHGYPIFVTFDRQPGSRDLLARWMTKQLVDATLCHPELPLCRGRCGVWRLLL